MIFDELIFLREKQKSAITLCREINQLLDMDFDGAGQDEHLHLMQLSREELVKLKLSIQKLKGDEAK